MILKKLKKWLAKLINTSQLKNKSSSSTKNRRLSRKFTDGGFIIKIPTKWRMGGWKTSVNGWNKTKRRSK